MNTKRITEELRKIALLNDNIVFPIEVGDDRFYINKNNEIINVCLPFDYSEELYEEFVGMEVFTSKMIVESDRTKVLVLRSKTGIDINKFLLIASSFISEKEGIILDPYSWIDRWKEIFGDSLSNKMVYDVVAEMLTLLHFYKTDKSFIWAGRKGCTHDIVGATKNIEVKATLQKTSNEIHINSAYQISVEKETKLVFVRLERKENGELSIDSLKEQLIQNGYDERNIEENLENAGYKIGGRNRKEKFELLGMYLFDINKDNFPIICLQDINEFASKKNILGYQLKLDLTPVDKFVIFEKE